MPSGLSPMHVMVFLLVALLVLGPHRLLDGARHAGKFLGEFRRWSEEIKGEVRGSISVDSPPAQNGSSNGSVDGSGSNGNSNGNAPAAGSDSQHQAPRLGIGPFARPEHHSES